MQPGYDSFCFKCHADNAVLSLTCKDCTLSFHRHCARTLNTPIPKNPDDFICIECIDIDKSMTSTNNKYNHPKIDVHTLKEMLLTILEKIRAYPDRDCFENEIQFKQLRETNQPLIITQMSLKLIEERILNNYYKVSEAFLHDIKQLEHNWMVVDRNKTKTLKSILKTVITEINEVEACVHCYSSSFVISNWFAFPCKHPHLLIWAKLKGYPYWPAKVMSVDSSGSLADVRFFGKTSISDKHKCFHYLFPITVLTNKILFTRLMLFIGAHDRAWVPVSHCLLFSDKDPNKSGKTTPTSKNASKTQKGIADAIKEKDEYIKNANDRYGFRLVGD